MYPQRKQFDWVTLALYFSLVIIGWIMLFAVGYGKSQMGNIAEFINTPIGKQSLWIALSFLSIFVIKVIDAKFWRSFSYPLYIFSILTLIGLFVFGKSIKGATSWYVFGGFSIQPGEFAKLTTALALANFLNRYNTNLKQFQSQLISIAFFLVPAGLIALQPDAGSALIFFSFFLVLFIKGFPELFYIVSFGTIGLLLLGFIFPPLNIIVILLLTGILVLIYSNMRGKIGGIGFLILGFASFIAILIGKMQYVILGNFILFFGMSLYFWIKNNSKIAIPIFAAIIIGSGFVYLSNYAFNNILKPHQQDRINVWLNPSKCDPQGSFYNVLQSKMAIASGGFTGKGFLKGNLTKGNYVPEQETDFIFCAIGEEQGFIGSFAIIILFMLLLFRIITIAERQNINFSKYYGYGIAGIIFMHFVVNIGMTIGLMPVIGVPLPFISKGGSAFLVFSMMLGILLKFDSVNYSK